MKEIPLSEKRARALSQGGLAAQALQRTGLAEQPYIEPEPDPDPPPADTTDDAILIELLAIREQVRRGRRYGYTLSLQVLRNKAMCLAEAFVDPDWAVEQREQVTAEQARIPAEMEAPF